MRALFIRLDKIGDLVCTLPVDEMLSQFTNATFDKKTDRETDKEIEITWVISKGLGFIPLHAEPTRNFIEIDKNKVGQGIHDLSQIIERVKPDIALSFQCPWWVNYTLWKERIPLRVGSKSQWHSIFLNRRLKQNRSQSIQHEFDYNLDLVKFAFSQSVRFDKSTPHIKVEKLISNSPILKLKTKETEQKKISLDLKKCIDLDSNYYVLHPGMFGSALNWPIANWIDLAELIFQNTSSKIVFTGTQIDEPWLNPIMKQLKSSLKGEFENRIISLQSKISANELLLVISKSIAVIAPSTGVLHLSASLGVPSFGIYSPIQVQNKIRWRARGTHVQIFDPAPIHCPAKKKCLGPKCAHYLCMDLIKPAIVFAALPKRP